MRYYADNKPLSLCYKLLLAGLGVFGLLIQLGLVGGRRFNPGVLKYFTTISNLLCVLYFGADALWLAGGERRAGDVLCPWLKGMVSFGVMMTWLIAHFLLGGGFSFAGMDSAGLTLLHYVVPIMALADWLLFDRKGRVRPGDPLLWLLLPLLYVALVFIGGPLGLRFGNSAYPYPFMNVAVRGAGRVWATMAALLPIFLGLGYLYYAIDALLGKAALRARKKDKEVHI